MKRFLILPILAIVLVCASCSSDDDKDSDSPKIAGSSWSGEEDSYFSRKIFTDIELQSTTFSLRSKIIYSDNSQRTEAFTGTYRYDPPTLTLLPVVDGEKKESIKFVVFKDKIANQEYGTLMKK